MSHQLCAARLLAVRPLLLSGGNARLRYDDRVGYPLWQFIVSPLHGRTIPSLDVPHPNLIHHAVHPFVFLKLTVDTTVKPAQLKGEWIDRDGKRVFDVVVTSDMLSPQ